MDPLIANADAMRADPLVAAEKVEFNFPLYPDHPIPCQLWHTSPQGHQAFPTPPSTPEDKRQQALLRVLCSVSENYSQPSDNQSMPILPEPGIIFTHGKGSALENDILVSYMRGFARTTPILGFTDQRPMTERVATFRALIHRYPNTPTIGGRSMGARAACRSAIYSPVHKLFFFTYPLVRGLDERYDELLALPANVDVLFIIGDEDPMTPELCLKGIRARMRARTWWVRLLKADHSVTYADPVVQHTICNVSGQIAAEWNADDDRAPNLTELTLRYNAAEGHKRVEWTGWMAPPPKPVNAPIQFNINVSGGSIPFGGGSFTFTL